MARLTRHPRRIVGQDQVVPAEMGEQAVAGGEIDPHLPLLGSDGARSPGRPGFECVHLVLRCWSLASRRSGSGSKVAQFSSDGKRDCERVGFYDFIVMIAESAGTAAETRTP